MLPNFEATSSPGRIMVFDSECRPLSYLSGDYTTGEVTAIAWRFLDEDEVQCYALSSQVGSLQDMLLRFRKAWREADLAVGHYILGHDLPVINGALMEQQMTPLEPKYVTDTKSHLKVSRYVSLSQESLAAMLGLEQQKRHMTQADWRRSNRLDPDGITVTRARVVDDVQQNAAMYERLKLLGWLNPPKYWDPALAKSFRYRP